MLHAKSLKQTCARYAPTVLRLALGIVFVVHGYQKIFQQGFGNVGDFFAGLGIPAALFFAYVVSLVEFVGGILLLLGVYVRFVAVLLAVTMLVAGLVVHLPNGFAVSNSGYEYAMVLMFASVSLVLSGGGALSLLSGCGCNQCQTGATEAPTEQN